MDFLIHIGIPKDPMPMDPRTILATMVHLDHKVIPGMMAHLNHMAVDIMAPLNHLAPGHSGNTAATNGPQTQHQYTYEPDHAQACQSRTDIEYENRRFQRCQDTLIKAYTEKDKYTGAAEEFLMPKVTIFKHRCKRARATPDDWAELFSVMLAGKALTWYMNTLEGHDLTFEDAVMAIHRTSETHSNYQGHLYEGFLNNLRNAVGAPF
ncbi:hypothetical protein E4U44_000350 [Claviceps purpurea]|nr:hypothetical protein E4U44_000350 [Claviceps purpurea]